MLQNIYNVAYLTPLLLSIKVTKTVFDTCCVELNSKTQGISILDFLQLEIFETSGNVISKCTHFSNVGTATSKATGLKKMYTLICK